MARKCSTKAVTICRASRPICKASSTACNKAAPLPAFSISTISNTQDLLTKPIIVSTSGAVMVSDVMPEH